MRWNLDRQINVLYDSRLKTAANRLSQELFNKDIFPTFQPPNKYTGELIGIEYLYNKTGAKNPVSAVEPDDSLLDEGFEDSAAMDDNDPTIHIVDSFLAAFSRERAQQIMQQNRPSQSEMSAKDVYGQQMYNVPAKLKAKPTTTSASLETTTAASMTKATAASVTTAAASTSSLSAVTTATSASAIAGSSERVEDEAEDSIGPNRVAGYGHVMDLAEYLFHLKDKESKAIANAEADHIVKLWSKMSPYDQSPSKYKDRHQIQLIKGRFKASKTSRIQLVPGVQSVRKCALATHLGPATWPDCNRYQEALLVKLCAAFPGSTTKDGVQQVRWRTVLEKYNLIREMVFNSQRVIQNTRIQLSDINQRTLTAWFSARGKRRERTLLEQGLALQ
ncbi:uncharacterized protein LOC127870114 [Dreissena polymorpha]|uniref:uncharacterized protein LOC127870114 n=1 Tax=Dreissena polymorpha TaxID=45954 RepID=UPI00226452B3|nr:uncharacterized protein LOC127870114 [Dreissena polymorpha]